MKRFRYTQWVTNIFYQDTNFDPKHIIIDNLKSDYKTQNINNQLWLVINSDGNIVEDDFGVDTVFIQSIIERCIATECWYYELSFTI